MIPILFILFGFGELLRIQLPNSAGIGVIDFVITAIFLIWFVSVKKRDYFLKIPILFFVAVGLLSLLSNIATFQTNEIIVGSLYLMRWVIYAGLYFVFVDIGKKFSNRVTIYMIFSGILVLLIGYIQFFFYPNLKNLYYLGWDDHLYRLFSSFLDPNFAGTFFVLFLIFILIIRSNFKSNKKILYFLNSTLLFDFIGIILTYSRSALLMLLISTLIYCAIQKNYKILFGLVGVLLMVIVILSPRFYLVNTNLFRIPSVEQRIENSKEALNIYLKKPILGVGFNNFRYAREKFGYPDNTPWGFSHSGGGADSSFALVLATTGIPGIITYLYLLYKMFKLGLSKIKRNPFALILIVSLGGLIINSILLNSLMYSFIMIWIWILAGLTESNSRE